MSKGNLFMQTKSTYTTWVLLWLFYWLKI